MADVRQIDGMADQAGQLLLGALARFRVRRDLGGVDDEIRGIEGEALDVEVQQDEHLEHLLRRHAGLVQVEV
ncbi:hypothetical protein RHCH11_RHCH11_01497 [Beijerinckiaceae bacterium RH CH11]|nr:hypothetical protein [Beijerinckiaceae bacterium]VVB44979.1 hypothetical protein RHCH11_RHCH11_01497 [Beijerinckiaceae bacterium RH CH11]VVB45058.1 hypothetical protein RHAL8_01494 [Beijerinckiaceae bacterium RH AL8]